MPFILTAELIRKIEQDYFVSGHDSFALMQCAGAFVADVITERFSGRHVIVLAGTGNNGGDGFVIAELLRSRKFSVEVFAVAPDVMQGDAAKAMRLYKGNISPLDQLYLNTDAIFVDALFGIGLSRPLEGIYAEVAARVNASGLPVVAVDIPSGLFADSSALPGAFIRANITVTFIAKKLAQLLLPAKAACGEVILSSLDVPVHLSGNSPVYANTPDLFISDFRWPQSTTHKYQRGHVIVAGGNASKAGAAKLTAKAALRSGCGLCTIISQPDDVAVYASAALSVMTATDTDWNTFMKDPRANTVVIGPGSGINQRTSSFIADAVSAHKKLVLDADALTVMAESPALFAGKLSSQCILTPHEGEFKRMFPAISGKLKHLDTLEAAKSSNAVVVYKGSDTVIASPDGRVAINTDAPPSLSVAGTGDVLAGICGGLLAQGMEGFLAACAAVWLHAEAARLYGEGLIAEDLHETLPLALHELKKYASVYS